jgi:ACS family tartrate transporter-like MFS transporter
MTSGLSIARSSIEIRTIRKLRIRILPFVFLLFIVALLDRFNIGFAALTMNKELAITSQQYGLVFGIFFVGYFIFELPSNLLLHRIGVVFCGDRCLRSYGTILDIA